MKHHRYRIVFAFALTLALVFSTTTYAAPIHINQIAQEISKDRIYKHITKLANRDNARVTGFDGEHRAANYIAKNLKKYGIKVERQTFPIMAFLARGSEVKVNTPLQKTLTSKPFNYTPATPQEGLSGKVVLAGMGKPEDFQGMNLEGKIALIRRGDITFYEKSQNAAKAGAAGVLIYNNTDGSLSGTLGQQGAVPTLALPKAEGEELKALVESDQPVTVTIKADVELTPSYSQNVIGTIKAKKGNPAKAKTIIVGAHYDGVDTPAANDNASGTATLLETAKALSDEKLRHNVKVIFFGAEEVGLVGSTRYVKAMSPEEKAETAAMINMDMVGVGDTIGIMTADPQAKSFVADRAEDYVKTYGYSYKRYDSTRSDHAPFEAAGIPVAFLNYHQDPYYHTDEDAPDKIDKNNLHRMGMLATLLTHNLANDPKLKSSNPSSMKSLNKQKSDNPEWKQK
ncbi:M20/M25/M40 family metallo-hydrolase [Salinithrix halophila]|uniref:M20/M25/M40 family metallo-hydrolase n=1 Tax=Salinithrix halophila TaxID=1485204 RepID=A0ABV8JEF2_9BACL